MQKNCKCHILRLSQQNKNNTDSEFKTMPYCKTIHTEVLLNCKRPKDNKKKARTCCLPATCMRSLKIYGRKAQYCLSPKMAVPTLTIVERHCTAIW